MHSILASSSLFGAGGAGLPLALPLVLLWPATGALAASHLRVDHGTGLIEELPESEIAADAVQFHPPVQHPGGQRPGR